MLLSSKCGLDKETAITLITTVLDKGVSLLLGAGASYGCHGGNGREIRGAPDLARDINDSLKLGLEEPDASNLALVYGDASQPPTKSHLVNLLRSKFTGCQPTWQAKLFAVEWKRIWTLNIDDVVQRAQPRSLAYPVETFDWTDEFRPRSLNRRELQLIHLHGRATQLDNDPDHLIFSLKEYANRHEISPGWHTEFRSEFAQKPFIVCGARLQDEYDLIGVIEYGNKSLERGGCPSIVVLPAFAPGQESRFRRQGLIPIASTGEEFFDALAKDVNDYKNCHPDNDPLYVSARSELKEKFRSLTISSTNPNRKLFDFYSSTETQWGHIVEDLDAPLECSANIAGWLGEVKTNVVRLALIAGGPVSGKTATALRVGATLFSKGFEVWLFRGEETFDALALIPYIKQTNKLVLIFDDCADYSSGLQRLTNEAAKSNALLRVVATTDEHRLRAVQVDIPTSIRKDYPIDPVRKVDFDSIVTKRLSKGRMGRCTSTATKDLWQEFRNVYNNRLLEWLESLENAHPYRDAILNIFKGKSANHTVVQNLLCATAAVQRFGYSLPLHLADEFRGLEPLNELIDTGGAMESLAYIDDRGLRLRSSAFSRFVWSNLSTKDKFDWSATIVRKIAPLVVPQTIARRTLSYLITRQLMDWENVKRDLGSDSERWYDDLEQVCGWNARFWEQRALLASDKKDALLAYSYAKKAIQLHGRDSFPWTTLGKICVKIGVGRMDQVGVARFWEGVEALDQSRKLSVETGLEWEHPYVTFFTYALRAYGCKHFDLERERLNHEWSQWMRDARASDIFPSGSSGRNSRLDDFHRQWLLNAATRTQ